MAIQNEREFDVVLGDVLVRTERVYNDQPRNGVLGAALRDLKNFAATMKKRQKPGPLEIQRFSKASDVVRGVCSGDDDMSDRLFDLADFVDLMKK
jgi:hypothetical protein